MNNRHVADSQISKAIKEAYGTLLDPHSYPVFLLYITLPFEGVDVNIHPRKEQIGFADRNFLYESLLKSVTDTLAQNNLLFQQVLHDEGKRSTQTFTGLLLKDTVETWNVHEPGSIVGSEIIQIHNLYIVAPTKRGVLLVDQHAAHERILYEQFTKAFHEKQNEQKKYVLKKSVSFELSATDAELLKEHGSVFEQMGFAIEEFKDTTFVLRAVPLLFQDRNYESLIAEILEHVSEERGARGVDEFSNKILKYLACRAAIKAGDQLTKDECKELLKKLDKTANYATCPHGRPTRVELPLSDFNKLFKR